MNWLHDIFQRSPEIAVFLSLAIGYGIGQVKLGKFQLGGVAGSLLAGVALSQVGVEIDSGAKVVLFALFIYAVGFECGPQFFASIGRQTLRELALAIVTAAAGLATVLVMARMFSLDKGMAAGVAAGALTQTGILGTAGEAIVALGLAPATTQQLQAGMAAGYAVSYMFGVLGTILLCVYVLPWLMGRGIRDDAIRAEREMQPGVQLRGPGQEAAVTELIGRLFQVSAGAGHTVGQIEHAQRDSTVSIERVKRKDQFIEVAQQLVLAQDDIVLVVGRRAEVIRCAGLLGKEVYAVDGMELTMQRRDVVITNADYQRKTIGELRHATAAGVRHGVYVVQLSRMGRVMPMSLDAAVQTGDTVTLYGVEADVQRAARVVGDVVLPSDKTDFVYLGGGLVAGLLVGLFSVTVAGIPLSLGSAGGALLAGLVFGWYRARRQTFGAVPPGALLIMKELGLAGFIAILALQSGLLAVQTVQAHGFGLFAIGVVVTLVPLLVTMGVGRFILRYDNTAYFAGALAGARSAGPAFGEVQDKAGNAVPTAPFAITYALASVFLTLLGPVIVALA
ncbi:aspartate-alanine antiporter [Variovorax rhizosphaerae]|uniref:Aspartate-alanine antiporter n=1 Tax=Variovorax rhizosphaerae TaxID=1836200 RepID=A0ABU8WX02_9BURK